MVKVLGYTIKWSGPGAVVSHVKIEGLTSAIEGLKDDLEISEMIKLMLGGGGGGGGGGGREIVR